MRPEVVVGGGEGVAVDPPRSPPSSFSFNVAQRGMGAELVEFLVREAVVHLGRAVSAVGEVNVVGEPFLVTADESSVGPVHGSVGKQRRPASFGSRWASTHARVPPRSLT